MFTMLRKINTVLYMRLCNIKNNINIQQTIFTVSEQKTKKLLQCHLFFFLKFYVRKLKNKHGVPVLFLNCKFENEKKIISLFCQSAMPDHISTALERQHE